MMKLFLLLCFILFPYPLDARTGASGRTQASTRVVISGFTNTAVDFDGATGFLRGGALTGGVDSRQGSYSIWVKMQGNSEIGTILRSRNGAPSNGRIISLFLSATDSFSFAVRNCATGGVGWFAQSDFNTLPVENVWHNILASWDLTVGSRHHLFIDDVDVEVLLSFANNLVCWSATNWTLGANLLSGPNNFFDGCMASFYVNSTEYIDFSVEANRRLFIGANGGAVDLGANGSIPTGTSPIIYLNGDKDTFQTNLGTGGDFTLSQGGLTNCDDTPPSGTARAQATGRLPESC